MDGKYQVSVSVSSGSEIDRSSNNNNVVDDRESAIARPIAA